MVRVLGFIIMCYSLIELFLVWKEWYDFRREWKKNEEIKGYFKNYMKLTLKTIIPSLLSILGILVTFVR